MRAYFESSREYPFELVALNELAAPETLAHLIRYDSTHGKFSSELKLIHDINQTYLEIAGKKLHVLQDARIGSLPWAELGVTLVLECTGAFTDRKTAEIHLQQGAQRVLFSQPADSDVDATIVYGFNESLLRASHKIVSNASCTTNSIVPILSILLQRFGLEHGVLTTIHSAMNDQPVIDAYHNTDLRKTRAAFQSIIPVDTGLARGIERLLPELSGRFEAQAMRVPVQNVSLIDLSVILERDASIEEVHEALLAAARAQPDIIGCISEPLASCDFNHDTRSAIVDLGQTRLAGRRLLKLLVWFDNEWGFANRMLDTAAVLTTLND